MKTIKLFFSWQSDINDNHKYMKSGLECAIKKLNKNTRYHVVYDESTRGLAGTAKIDNTVENKIDHCDVFVADVTPITSIDDKQMPNSNVMMELGRALKALPLNRIVILACKGEWKIKDLPFDINHYSVIPIDIKDRTCYLGLIKDSIEDAWKSPMSCFDEDDHALYSEHHINSNIQSGKYIPDTFLEKNNIKEHLRYFSDPILFSELLYEKAFKLNFDSMNRYRIIWGKAKYNYDVSNFSPITDKGLDALYNSVESLRVYVKSKYDELNGQHDNKSSFCSIKSGKIVEDLNYLLAKVFLLTADAGQGKTNFLCDFCKNVLIKRHIPFVYLNGYEIDPSDIERSFYYSLFPNTNITWGEVVDNLQNYSVKQNKPILFIIDGLNENPEPREFCRNLEGFIKRIITSADIKVIMTCRTHYFEEHFSGLELALGNDLVLCKNIYSKLEERDIEKLLTSYLKYFNIKADLENHIKNQLCDNFLLLRIFSEANKGKDLGHVSHIKKDELFAQYYELMSDRVIQIHESNNKNLDLMKDQITDFVIEILRIMIDKDIFYNVPLDSLRRKFDDNKMKVFSHFLDENILLRKDIKKNKGIFGSTYVVNFTYDAFRDYLIAHYIIDYLSDDSDCKKELIGKYTDEKHQLREGIIPFLFVYCKNSGNTEIEEFIKTQSWYGEAFEAYIWDVDEECLTTFDIDFIKAKLQENPRIIARYLLFWGRWDTTRYKVLNITILLQYVESMDDDNLKAFMDNVWQEKPVNRFGYNYNENSESEDFVISIEGLLKDGKVLDKKESESIFYFFAFFAAVKGTHAQDIYKLYIQKSNNYEQLSIIEKNTKSYKLKSFVESLIKYNV